MLKTCTGQLYFCASEVQRGHPYAIKSDVYPFWGSHFRVFETRHRNREDKYGSNKLLELFEWYERRSRPESKQDIGCCLRTEILHDDGLELNDKTACYLSILGFNIILWNLDLGPPRSGLKLNTLLFSMVFRVKCQCDGSR